MHKTGVESPVLAAQFNPSGFGLEICLRRPGTFSSPLWSNYTRGFCARRSIHDKGLAGSLLRVKGERDGNEQSWDRGSDALCWIAAHESIG